MKIIQQSVFSKISVALVAVMSVFIFNSCATLKDLGGLSNMQFMLQNVTQTQLAGIDISNKRSISDFSPMDAIKLTSAFASGKFPLTFTLNVAAKNPNQPQAGSAISSVSLSNFPWRLLLDGKETISGNIGSPVALPSGGTTQIIPLSVSIDLKQFFGNQGYNDILNLALALSGQGAAKLQLKATPTVRTNFASYTWPNEMTIVSTEFRS